MSITGRRPNERANRFAKSFMEGLSFVGTALADGPKHERIREIDVEIERLQQEKDALITSLIEPGDLKVSDGYDPNKAVIIKNVFSRPGDGRLVLCKGRRTTSTYHDAHPGCPYVDTIHNSHEFTLRD